MGFPVPVLVIRIDHRLDYYLHLDGGLSCLCLCGYSAQLVVVFGDLHFLMDQRIQKRPELDALVLHRLVQLLVGFEALDVVFFVVEIAVPVLDTCFGCDYRVYDVSTLLSVPVLHPAPVMATFAPFRWDLMRMPWYLIVVQMAFRDWLDWSQI